MSMVPNGAEAGPSSAVAVPTTDTLRAEVSLSLPSNVEISSRIETFAFDPGSTLSSASASACAAETRHEMPASPASVHECFIFLLRMGVG